MHSVCVYCGSNAGARPEYAARATQLGERIARAVLAAPFPAPHGALEVAHRARLPASDPARVQALRQLVGESLGPLRHGTAMTSALSRLASWRCDSRAEEDTSMVAQLMLTAALARRESRGAHYRSEYPLPAEGMPTRAFTTPPAFPLEILAPARSRVA